MGDFSIQISSELVNRLANDGERLGKKPRRTKPKIPRKSASPQTRLGEKQLRDDNKGLPSPGWPLQPPLFLPVPHQANAELEEIKSVIQESERVLEKLRNEEDSIRKQVTERAKDLHDKEFKLPYQKPMPCLTDYDACRACYKENANDILKCAPLVRSYYDCVRIARQQVGSPDK